MNTPWKGPVLVTLLDGTMVWNDAEAWRAECEARSVSRLSDRDRAAYYFEIDRVRGTEASEKLREAVSQVESARCKGCEQPLLGRGVFDSGYCHGCRDDVAGSAA